MARIKLKGGKKGSNKKSGKAYIEKTQWHPAFFQAMQIELQEYKEHLTYEDEHHLTTEPLRVDILIIKKDPGLRIEKNIGRIFRGHNIVEFKGPEDSLSIYDYYKVMGYANLYCYLEKVLPQDLTITLAFTVHPDNLFEHLKTRPEITIEYRYEGIQYIKGEAISIQLIESKLLDSQENLWLRALTQKLPVPVLKNIILERDKIFPSETGTYRDERNVLTAFNRLLTKLDIPKAGRNVHSLRRTFTTMQARSGVPVTVTQKILGHSNALMTMDVYTETEMADKAAAMDVLSNQFVK